MQSVFNFKAFTNQELMDMCYNEESLKDVYISHLCVSINDITLQKAKKDILNLLLQSNVAMIIQLELEMKKRDILKIYRKNISYPDYLNEKFYHYDSYQYRIQHLADLAVNQKLTHEKINQFYLLKGEK